MVRNCYIYSLANVNRLTVRKQGIQTENKI